MSAIKVIDDKKLLLLWNCDCGLDNLRKLRAIKWETLDKTINCECARCAKVSRLQIKDQNGRPLAEFTGTIDETNPYAAKPALKVPCPECNDTGKYVGFLLIEDCSLCVKKPSG